MQQLPRNANAWRALLLSLTALIFACAAYELYVACNVMASGGIGIHRTAALDDIRNLCIEMLALLEIRA